jgi:murein DD-endopeptidase MepM/ murein hydrolase activator NlpD
MSTPLQLLKEAMDTQLACNLGNALACPENLDSLMEADKKEQENPSTLLPEDISTAWTLPVDGELRQYENHPTLNGTKERIAIDIMCAADANIKAANHGKVIKAHKNPPADPWNNFVENGAHVPKRADEKIPVDGRSYSYLDHPGYSIFGNHIIIEHYKGTTKDGRRVVATTAYTHLKEIMVSELAPVRRGDIIAKSGGENMTRGIAADGEYFYFTNFGPDGTGGAQRREQGPLSVPHLHYEMPKNVAITAHTRE